MLITGLYGIVCTYLGDNAIINLDLIQKSKHKHYLKDAYNAHFLLDYVHIRDIYKIRIIYLTGQIRIYPRFATRIRFDDKFNQSLGNFWIAANITHIRFGNDFNMPLENMPSALTHLVFGFNFNQPLVNLPSSLTHLTLGFKFRQPITQLQESIKCLSLDKIYYNHLYRKGLLKNDVFTHVTKTMKFLIKIDNKILKRDSFANYYMRNISQKEL